MRRVSRAPLEDAVFQLEFGSLREAIKGTLSGGAGLARRGCFLGLGSSGALPFSSGFTLFLHIDFQPIGLNLHVALNGHNISDEDDQVFLIVSLHPVGFDMDGIFLFGLGASHPGFLDASQRRLSRGGRGRAGGQGAR